MARHEVMVEIIYRPQVDINDVPKEDAAVEAMKRVARFAPVHSLLRVDHVTTKQMIGEGPMRRESESNWYPPDPAPHLRVTNALKKSLLDAEADACGGFSVRVARHGYFELVRSRPLQLPSPASFIEYDRAGHLLNAFIRVDDPIPELKGTLRVALTALGDGEARDHLRGLWDRMFPGEDPYAFGE